MPRILFVAAHRPDRSPSQRYRFEQFIPYWETHGWEVRQAWLIDEGDDAVFYAPGHMLRKGLLFARSWLRRLRHVDMAREADIVFVQREAFMTGSIRFEQAMRRTGARFIFDFDDAIWRLDVSEGNRRLRWLKDPGKTDRLIAMADLVIAGNRYLADHALPLNPRTVVIPTVVDTDRYLPVMRKHPDKVIIGWTGSLTSIAYLREALPMLRRLQQRFGGRIGFRIISDHRFTDPGLDVDGLVWNSATEAEDLAGIDIGIMPMPDNEWSKGKCGFKGLQYMGMGKAVVLAAVGVNTEIVQDGINGCLARDEAEWTDRLSKLIEDADLRLAMGRAARRTVEEKYSVIAWRDRYIDHFNALITPHGDQHRPEEDRPHPRT